MIQKEEKTDVPARPAQKFQPEDDAGVFEVVSVDLADVDGTKRPRPAVPKRRVTLSGRGTPGLAPPASNLSTRHSSELAYTASTDEDDEAEKKRKKKEVQRNHALKEIIETEKIYYQNLVVLLRVSLHVSYI